MWKQKPGPVPGSILLSVPEPIRVVSPAPSAEVAARPRPAAVVSDQAVIGKGIHVTGEITGVDPLHIDGNVEGSIQIPGERVTVGKHGNVIGAKAGTAAPCISAREIVVIGRVTGNISATDRVEIRAEGWLTGDVITARVSIEDGAYIRGGIDIRRDEAKATAPPAAVGEPTHSNEPVGRL